MWQIYDYKCWVNNMPDGIYGLCLYLYYHILTLNLWLLSNLDFKIPVENNYSTVVRRDLWALKVLKLVIAQHSRCEYFKKTENEFDKLFLAIALCQIIHLLTRPLKSMRSTEFRLYVQVGELSEPLLSGLIRSFNYGEWDEQIN